MSYRPELDGLRTIAVYLVVLFHADLPWAAGGFIGVDLFFCLSGFLVAGVILAEIESTGHLRLGRFYARRVRRLLPAAVLVVVATCLVFLVLWTLVRRAEILPDARSALLYYANWHFLASSGDYFAADVGQSPFLHFWSLAIEEQFYVVFPLLLLLVHRPGGRARRRTAAVLAGLLAASVAAQLLLAPGDADRAYYGTDARVYQLLGGALLAVGLEQLRRRTSPRQARAAAVAGLTGLLVLGSALVSLTPSHRGLGATVAAVLALGGLALAEGGAAQRALSTRVPVYLGRISYGTYLWHWPVILVVTSVLDVGALVLAVVAGVVATGLAALSSEVLEMPVRRTPRLDRWSWQVAAVGVAASALVAATIVPLVLGSERRPVAAATRGDDQPGARSGRPVPDLDFAALAGQRGQQVTCTADDPGACVLERGDGPHVLLVGDSQARTMVPVLRRVARERGLTFSANVMDGCSWLEGLRNGKLRPGEIERCDAARVGWYDEVLPELDPDLIVLLSRPRDDVGEWQGVVTAQDGDGDEDVRRLTLRSMRETVAKARAVAPTVEVQRLVMPEDFEPLDCLAAAERIGACAVGVPLRPAASDGFAATLATESDDVGTADLNGTLCPDAPVCQPVVGGIAVWRDDHHYTIDFPMAHRDELWEAISGAVAWAGGTDAG